MDCVVTPLKTLMGFSVHLNVQLKFYNLPKIIMQLKTNKKEVAKMSKSIKVKKICNGNKESKDVLSQYLRIKELENSLNLYLKLETINSYKINVQIALLRFKNTVGYIKFVDRKYMKNFFNLKSIWLSNIDTFTRNSEEAADNLIDDWA